MKKKKLFWSEICALVAYIFMIVGVGLFGVGMFLIPVGFHNFDLGHNIHYLNAEYNLDLVDYSDGRSYTDYQLIDSGVRMMLQGLFFVIVGLTLAIVELYALLAIVAEMETLKK